MKIRKTPHILILIVVLAAASFASCVSPLAWSRYADSLDSLSVDAWKTDIASLESELLNNHPKLKSDPSAASAVRSATVAAMVDVEAASDASSRRDAAIAGIARVCAAVGDGHTRINASPASQYPVALRFYPVDTGYATTKFELRVYAVCLPDGGAETPSYGASLGKKVDSIGGHSVPEALAMLVPALSIESGLGAAGLERLKTNAERAESLNAFMNPMLMRGLGLAAPDGLSLMLEGEPLTISELTQEEAANGYSWRYAIDPAAPTAVFRQNPDVDIWHEVLGDHPDTMYMAFRSCPSDPGTAFDEVIRDIEASPALSRLIVDMRVNSGGNSMPGTAFAGALGATALAKRRGGVIVLVGPYTFSSALMNAADILAACGAKGDPDSGNALLAGEPMIEPIDHYGEIYRFSLPNSGVVIGRSKKFWQYSKTSGIAPTSGFLSPPEDWTRVPTFEEYRRGEDPVFDLVLPK